MFIVYLIGCVLNKHNFGRKITEFNWDFQILGKKCARRTKQCLDQVVLLVTFTDYFRITMTLKQKKCNVMPQDVGVKIICSVKNKSDNAYTVILTSYMDFTP